MSSQIRKMQKREMEAVAYIAAVWEQVEHGRFLLWARTWVSQLWRATHWTGYAAFAWVLGWFLLCLLVGLSGGR